MICVMFLPAMLRIYCRKVSVRLSVSIRYYTNKISSPPDTKRCSFLRLSSVMTLERDHS